MKEKTLLDLYCLFAGWQGGTIHQAIEDFKARPLAEKDKFCGILCDNMKSLTLESMRQARQFMAWRLEG